MAQTIEAGRLTRDEAYYRLRSEIEEFFYDEAEHIDNRRFQEWLEMLHEDLRYFMPMRHNVKFGQHAERENTREDEGISLLDKLSGLRGRIAA